MSAGFDPYYTWLGIPPEEQPPDHYRLLGVRRFETNAEVIANVSDQRMTHLRTFQNGKRSAESQKLLNEISAATRTLLDPQLRGPYDANLKQKLAAAKPVVAKAIPSPGAATLPTAQPLMAAPADSLPQPTALPQALPVAASVIVKSPGTAAAPRKSPPLGIIIAASVAGLVLLSGGIVAVAALSGAFSRPTVVANNPPAVNPPAEVPTPPLTNVPPAAPPANTNPESPATNLPPVSNTVSTDANPEVVAPPGSPQTSPTNPPSIPGSSSSPSPNDPRKKWVYGGVPGKVEGEIRLVSEGRWEEKNSAGATFSFQEVSRNPNQVELFDESRNLRVHLRNNFIDFNRNGKGWVRGQPGTWSHLMAAGLEVDQPFDLLSLDWQALRFRGGFSKQGEFWRSAGQPAQPDGVSFPFDSPAEYIWDATFIRRSGKDSITFVINFGGRQGSIVINGFPTAPEGALSGLQFIDGRQLPNLQDPAPLRGPIIENDKLYTFHCEVTADRIVAKIDDQVLCDWAGPPGRLSPDPFTRPPLPTRLAIVTWESTYEIQKMVLTPKKLRPSSSAPLVAATTQPGNPPSFPPGSEAPSAPRQFISLRNRGSFGIDRATTLLDLTTPSTLELWIRPQSSDGALVDAPGLRLWTETVPSSSKGNRTQLHLRVGSAESKGFLASFKPDWHHFAITSDGDWIHVFYDGLRITTTRRPAGALSYKELEFGMTKDRNMPILGDLAELRLSNVCRYRDRFQPQPLRGDADTELYLVPTLRGVEVVAKRNARPSWHMTSASFQGSDGSFPPQSAGSSESASSPPASVATEPVKREAAPDAEALQAAKARIKDAYGDKLKAAAKPEDKSQLARELLQIAQNEKEGPAAYALLIEARALSVASAQVDVGLEVMNELDRRFEVDRFTQINKLLTELATKTSGDQRDALLDEAISLVQSATAAERYDVADSASQLAVSTANRGKDVEQKKRTKALRDRMLVVKHAWEGAETAKEKLEADGNDEAAHLTLGKYLAFIRADWAAGIEHLAKGSDDKLASAAKAEAAAQSPTEELAAAELWRTASESLKGEDRSALQRHALDLFRKLGPKLTGLDQATADKRTKELEPLIADAEKTSVLATRVPRSKPEPGLILRLMVLPFNTSNPTPVATPYLAIMEDSNQLYRLPIGQSLVDYGVFQVRHVWAGQLILDRDMDLDFELEDVNCLIGTQAVGGSATSNRQRTTVPWKKGTYKVLITSNDSSPYVRITRSGTGQSMLYHSEQDLQKEMDKVVPLPKGGVSKGIRIDK